VPASAAGQLLQAASSLRSNPVFVAPGAKPTISSGDAERLRRKIRTSGAAPMFIAVLPASAVGAGGGTPEGVLRNLHDDVHLPGTYAVVVGGKFRAGATAGVLPQGEAGRLATEAFQEHHQQGVAATLAAFVDAVGAERSGAAPGPAPGPGDGGPGGSGTGLIVVLALAGGGFFLFHRVRAARREQEALAEVRAAAHDDLVALADDVQKLESGVDAPNAPGEAKEDYQAALERYDTANQAFDRARRPEDMARVTEALEEGRYRMACADARLHGRQPPERRPPCFFDPRHGPSTRDVQWAPPGGTPRAVPACEACAVAVDEGREPAAREVVTGGRRVPYYAAPAYFSPWAGGFFSPFGGGGFLSGLFLGELLGGGFGGFGGGWGSYGGWGGYDAPSGGDFGGFGGGGDFGSGGGDFGGGDFGGGGGDF
jgi:hypothetical protein